MNPLTIPGAITPDPEPSVYTKANLGSAVSGETKRR